MNIDSELRKIMDYYDDLVKGVSKRAAQTKSRASGGLLRAERGKLQEKITTDLILLAWKSLGQPESRIEINSKKIAIKIEQEYVQNLKDDEIRNYIKDNINDYVYKISVDKHVFVDGEFVMGIECKSYTENAMIKRIAVDFDFLLSKFPAMSCYLFQLESQLGGDYAELKEKPMGSKSTHTILSKFECDLTIFTFLKGERDIKRPIFEHYKPLRIGMLKRALELLKRDLSQHV